MIQKRNPPDRGDAILVADPTPLATQRLAEAVTQLKELNEAKEKVLLARLDAMDKAVKLLQSFPTAIDTAIKNLRELHEEKFEGVGVRFTELNTRLTEGDRYKQTALDAALKAAQTLVDKQQENNKEAINKTDLLFTKQLDAVKETVEDLKGIVKDGVGVRKGIDATTVFIIAVAGIALTAINIITAWLHH